MLSDKVRNNLPQILTAILALLCLLTVCIVHFFSGYDLYAYAPYAYYMITPESRTEESIPAYGGRQVTYTFTVPDGAKVQHGARLSFYLRHTMAQVWLDDDLHMDMHESDDWHIGKTPGNFWITIKMRPDYSGKKLTLVLTPVYKNLKWEEPRFLLIDHGDLLNLIVQPEDRLLLILSVSALISGAFLSITTLFMKINPQDRKRLFNLGAIAFCIGLCKFTNLPVTALTLDLYGIQKELWYLGAAVFLIVPLLILLFIDNQLIMADEDAIPGSFDLNRRSRDDLRKIFFINAVLLFFVIVLQLLNIVDFYEILSAYCAVCVVFQLIALFSIKWDRRSLIRVMPFPAAAALDTLIFVVSGSGRSAIVSLVWILLSLIFRAAGFISETIVREHQLYETKAKLQEAQIRGMIHQIRPHFIYNTLTSVYVLCRDDPPRAMEVIRNFIDYLQSNFSALGAETLITFSDELHHTRAYLAVESIRFGDKLIVEYDIKHSAFRLPPLTLQPLVENAVKYGVGKGHSPEHILIHTHAENGGAVISVEDDGPGFDPAVSEETNSGIQNVRDRLALMCGGMLEIQSQLNHGTIVIVRIPPGEG